MPYRIENTTSGVVLGIYPGETPEEAWAALCVECGCDEEPGDDIRFYETAEEPAREQ